MPIRAFACSFLYFAAAGSLPAETAAIPKDTPIAIRTVDAIESKQRELGQNYRCTLDASITSAGREVAPKGADCVLRIVETKKAGALTGNNELKLVVSQIRIGADLLDVNSDPVAMTAGSKGKSTATRAGILGGIGATIGGIKDGAKGALIGGGVGAAAGAASSALTQGPQIKVASETVLTFVIR
jgi:hypothetical protein